MPMVEGNGALILIGGNATVTWAAGDGIALRRP